MEIELTIAAGRGTEKLTLDAVSEAAAVRLATARGLRVLAVVPQHNVQAPGFWRRGRFSLMLFSQELLALLEAGLTLIEALQALHNKETRTDTRELLAGVLAELREGRNFSDVLASRPIQFPELYVATVKAAERSGNLAEALSRYVVYRLQFDGIRRKLISAAIYPAMLMLVGAGVSFFLLGWVVPRFAAVYANSGRPLPWLSGLLLQFGHGLNQHGRWFIAAVCLLLVLLAWTVFHAPARSRLMETVLRLPSLARRAAEFRLSRFYRTLALLLAAGIPLAKGLSMVRGLFPPAQAVRLDAARLAVEEGLSFSLALEQAGLVTAIGSSLIRVGEQSGRLGEMLERAARFHDDDFSRWVDWASRLLEPLLMVVMGGVIGTVVVLLYLPIFDLADTLR